MSNKLYDILKWIAIVFMPLFVTFLGVVLNSLEVANTDIILTILTAFETFLGGLLGYSNINYKKSTEIKQ